MKFEKAANKLYENIIEEQKNGKTSYYKRRKISPWLDKEGNIKWFNFLTGGSWMKLGITILIVAIVLGGIYNWGNTLNNYANLVSKVGNNSMCRFLVESRNTIPSVIITS